MQRLWRALVNSVRLRHRLLIAIAVALLALAALHGTLDGASWAAAGWNAGGLTYLALGFSLMSTCTVERIRKLARIEDEARFVFFALIILAIISSFYAVFNLIGDARQVVGWHRSTLIGLAALTVLVSWLVMQIDFTLHYAHSYYGERPGHGGIAGGMIFPHDEHPDYWDFFYFTTSIGATSQTSDVMITSKAVRRMVAFQSVLSFFFNTTVVALAINLASGAI
jgi:uncharacterized membrane protein